MALGLRRDQAIVRGKYVLEGRLGEGGMSEVWRAENTKTRQTVALKFPKRSSRSAVPDRRRFLREATLAVRHPHIVYIHDIEELNEDIPFLVMEELRGRTLRSELRQRGALPFERSVNILFQLASAVGTLRAHGIVHRDLKPDNIFLTENGVRGDFAKVLDFGIARSLRGPADPDDVDPTGAHGAFGTPGYMPPEQVRPTGDVGPEADVWSLGIVLCECLSGEHPWLSRTEAGVEVDTDAREWLESDTVAALSTMFPDLPPDVRDAMSGALQPDPARRIPIDVLFAALAVHATVDVPPIPEAPDPERSEAALDGRRHDSLDTERSSLPRNDATTRTHPGGSLDTSRELAGDRLPELVTAGRIDEKLVQARSAGRSRRAQALVVAAGLVAVTGGFGAAAQGWSSGKLSEIDVSEVGSTTFEPAIGLPTEVPLPSWTVQLDPPVAAPVTASEHRVVTQPARSGHAPSKRPEPAKSEGAGGDSRPPTGDGTRAIAEEPPSLPPPRVPDSARPGGGPEQPPPGGIHVFHKGAPPF